MSTSSPKGQEGHSQLTGIRQKPRGGAPGPPGQRTQERGSTSPRLPLRGGPGHLLSKAQLWPQGHPSLHTAECPCALSQDSKVPRLSCLPGLPAGTQAGPREGGGGGVSLAPWESPGGEGSKQGTRAHGSQAFSPKQKNIGVSQEEEPRTNRLISCLDAGRPCA